MIITVQKIINDVESYKGLTSGEIVAKGRTKTLAEARKLAMILAREYTRYSQSELADIFHRDRTSLIDALKQKDKYTEDLKRFKRRYNPSFLQRLLRGL